MKTFTTSFIAAKNALEGKAAWAHLVEIVVNANSTAFFTSHPETLTYNSQLYAPVPMSIGEEEQSSDGELPRLNINVSNLGGHAYRFAKDNDLSLNNVTIRLINTTLVASGNEDAVRMQVLGSTFVGELGTFILGLGFNYDAMGPRGTYDRTSYPTIPYNLRQFGIL